MTIAGALGLLVLLGVVYRGYRHKVATNNVLAEQNEAILATNREVLELNDRLSGAMAEVNRLSGLLPICASCKDIRDDKGYWSQVESFISSHSEAEFTHSICPTCAEKMYGEVEV